MKELAAAQADAIFQCGDDLFESLRGQGRAVEQQKRQMAEHVACRITREDGVILHFGQEFLRVVMKNEMQKVGEGATVCEMWTEKCGGAFAPRELRCGWVTEKPALLAQNFGHLAGCENA